jgi:hypothetical protein
MLVSAAQAGEALLLPQNLLATTSHKIKAEKRLSSSLNVDPQYKACPIAGSAAHHSPVTQTNLIGNSETAGNHSIVSRAIVSSLSVDGNIW